MSKKIVLTFITALFLSVYSLAIEESNPFKDTFITIGGGYSNPITQIGHFIATGADENGNDIGSYKYQDVKSSSVFAMSIGKNFGSIKTELEYIDLGKNNYTQGGYANEDNYGYTYSLSSKAYMFNLGYSFNNLSQRFQPYITAAIGLSEHKASSSELYHDGIYCGYDDGHTTKNLAKGVTLGARVNLNEHFAFDFSYKYLDLGKVKGSTKFYTGSTTDYINNDLDGEVVTNIFMAKAVVKF
ncbi:MAG: outer membrane beta-barrel protein [Rickettsiales bacterium]